MNFSQPERPDHPAELALITFCESRIFGADELKKRIRQLDAELADFLDTLEKFGALDLHLNPVGLMLAAQEEKIRSNGEKSDLLESLQPSRNAATSTDKVE
ncbi:hypothetical protein [Mycobacterium sp. IS-1742]|uniref:hypothetical protein n=1 Tax=Mycobacterium sp. IS-1742 TaxID=1772285 RepID=UPI0018D218EB|nr:hypothetical protein [Mycobacterium sp. IS-1742]